MARVLEMLGSMPYPLSPRKHLTGCLPAGGAQLNAAALAALLVSRKSEVTCPLPPSPQPSPRQHFFGGQNTGKGRHSAILAGVPEALSRMPIFLVVLVHP